MCYSLTGVDHRSPAHNYRPTHYHPNSNPVTHSLNIRKINQLHRILPNCTDCTGHVRSEIPRILGNNMVSHVDFRGCKHVVI